MEAGAWPTKEALAGHDEGRLCGGDREEHLRSNKMSPRPPTVEKVHRRLRTAAVACLKRQ